MMEESVIDDSAEEVSVQLCNTFFIHLQAVHTQLCNIMD